MKWQKIVCEPGFYLPKGPVILRIGLKGSDLVKVMRRAHTKEGLVIYVVPMTRKRTRAMFNKMKKYAKRHKRN